MTSFSLSAGSYICKSTVQMLVTQNHNKKLNSDHGPKYVATIWFVMLKLLRNQRLKVKDM